MMFGKLKKIGASYATFLISLSAAEVRLITSYDKPEEYLMENEFNVFSFFDPSNAESVETDQIM